jgi:hypothetical protein
MEALLWIGLTALLIAAPFIYPRWRLRRVLARPLPPAAEAVVAAKYPRLQTHEPGPAAAAAAHGGAVPASEKFIGCEGLDVTDEMAVTIAGQACLLLLNRPSKVYPALHTILVYPSEFVAQRAEVGPGGVVTPGRQSMLGESGTMAAWCCPGTMSGAARPTGPTATTWCCTSSRTSSTANRAAPTARLTSAIRTATANGRKCCRATIKTCACTPCTASRR